MRAPERDLDGLLHELGRMISVVDRGGGDALVPGSDWTAGQHLQHIGKALLFGGRAFRLLEAAADSGSTPDPRVIRGPAAKHSPAARLSPAAEALLAQREIVRGQAEAPAHVTPDAEVSGAHVVELGRKQLRNWEDRRDSVRLCETWRDAIAHPILGPLTAHQWIQFNFIHVRHHRRIILPDSID